MVKFNIWIPLLALLQFRHILSALWEKIQVPNRICFNR